MDLLLAYHFLNLQHSLLLFFITNLYFIIVSANAKFETAIKNKKNNNHEKRPKIACGVERTKT